ncbi:MAG TPA: NAD-dependent epimerase/dehydratase family protein [Ktedonobacterales bacterium]|nr:NAD-dependent epimerase/dehydratase family protein [Ktedonobacterales bacterium]
MPEIAMVTGAFSFTGKYLTRRLLTMDQQVRTLTGHPDNPNPFGEQVAIFPYNFDHFDALVGSLQGVSTFYISYWVRFAYRAMTFERAVEHTRTLFRAARAAGVRRVVYISISNPSEDSPLPYFHGKAGLERTLRESGLSHAILRPTVIFGPEGILINNIAWLVRRFPVFAVMGEGDYRLQPIYVEDLADLMVKAAESQENLVMDAVGPETYRFDELVRLIADVLHRKITITHLSPGVMYFISRVMSLALGDVILTRDEISGLMANLLISDQAPTAHTRLSEWLSVHADEVGRRYASELQRHYR